MKLKQVIVLILLAGLALPMTAQITPVKWKTDIKEIDKSLYEVSVTAYIDSTYHIYDTLRTDFGPNATIVDFKLMESSRKASLADGITVSGELHTFYDDIFMMDIGYYADSVTFTKQVKLNGKKARADIQIYVEWMACDDNNCLPLADEELFVSVPDNGTVAAPSETSAGSTNIWALILEAIVWGFAMLLTPCVFPMIPMTVSYFLKGDGGVAKGRMRASLYGLFIVLLYTLPIAVIILVTRIAGGESVTADIFNWLATHWLPNIIFFIVFMIFAASFFGAFEITMPEKLVNKSDSKADVKGIGGIFFLALTLVLVSFSCTGPIVGTVLIKSTQGEFWTPIITMLAFSIAFALPFTIFALFPSMLKKLPKSGGWLNTVKVVIAFIEVALGFKFLSMADQTYHWGILDREVYLAIWIVIFTLLGLYLLGKIRFAHDDEVTHLGVGRLTLVIVVFSFVVYMIPGMWGAPLKALSGYLPPITSQDFVLTTGSNVQIVNSSTGGSTSSVDLDNRKYSDFLHLPHGLVGFFELEQAKAYAEKVGKPIFIDFTGHGCVNCREMEMRVWSDPRVLEILRNEYVICALYCDDKKQVDEEDWMTVGDKTFKTIGKINSHIANTKYQVNAQPCYVLQGRNDTVLVPPRSYNLDIDGFISFLKEGVRKYAEQ